MNIDKKKALLNLLKQYKVQKETLLKQTDVSNDTIINIEVPLIVEITLPAYANSNPITLTVVKIREKLEGLMGATSAQRAQSILNNVKFMLEGEYARDYGISHKFKIKRASKYLQLSIYTFYSTYQDHIDDFYEIMDQMRVSIIAKVQEYGK